MKETDLRLTEFICRLTGDIDIDIINFKNAFEILNMEKHLDITPTMVIENITKECGDYISIMIEAVTKHGFNLTLSLETLDFSLDLLKAFALLATTVFIPIDPDENWIVENMKNYSYINAYSRNTVSVIFRLNKDTVSHFAEIDSFCKKMRILYYLDIDYTQDYIKELAKQIELLTYPICFSNELIFSMPSPAKSWTMLSNGTTIATNKHNKETFPFFQNGAVHPNIDTNYSTAFKLYESTEGLYDLTSKQIQNIELYRTLLMGYIEKGENECKI